MDFEKALNIKKQIANSLVFPKARAARTVSLGSRSKAAAIAVESRLPNVVNGVGVGEKFSGENYIKILTRDTSPIDTSTIADYYGVQRSDLVVEEVGRIEFKSPVNNHRPPFPGISVGHFRITAGTLGCFVEDDQGKIYVLSNNHVLANTNRGNWKDPILQPGKFDGGRRSKDQIASLSSYVELLFNKVNTMDAAIAEIVDGLNPDFKMHGKAKIAGTDAPLTGMKVEKWGRTTGHTKGIITTGNVDIQVDFGRSTLDFQDQFEIKSRRGMFCDGGDSGSIILERDNFVAVGLLFAGNDLGTTFATPIDDVLTSFSVKIV